MNSSQSARNISAMFSELWRAKWAFVCTWIIVGAGTFAATYLWPCKWKAQTEFVPEYKSQHSRFEAIDKEIEQEPHNASPEVK